MCAPARNHNRKFPQNADLWMPPVQLPRLAEQKHNARDDEVFGHLADHVTPPQAQPEMNTIAAKLARDYPATNKEITARVMTFDERTNGGPTIVAIASTVRQRMQPGDDWPDPVVYIPLRAQAPVFAMLLIRAQRDPASLTALAREDVRALDPDLPLFAVVTMDQELAQQR